MFSPNTFKTVGLSLVLLAGALVISSTVTAAETTPEFAIKSVSNGEIRAGVAAFKKGDYARAAFFQQSALKGSLSKSRKTAALANLCAAEGAQGNLEAAAMACDQALVLSPNSADALNNREVVTYLTNKHTARLAN